MLPRIEPVIEAFTTTINQLWEEFSSLNTTNDGQSLLLHRVTYFFETCQQHRTVREIFSEILFRWALTVHQFLVHSLPRQ